MGKRGTIPKAKLAQDKESALKLARARRTPQEIADELGYKAPTVRKWMRAFRKAGQLQSVRDLVLDLATQGCPVKEIARIADRSESQVYRILRKAGEEPMGSVEECVRLFLSDPDRYMDAPFTRSEGFGRQLLATCLEASDKSARKGLVILEPATRIFDTLRRTLNGSQADLATCRLVQSRGMQGIARSHLGHHEQAARILQEIEGLAKRGCLGCEADYYRRCAYEKALWAYSTKSRRRYLQARILIDRALHLYRQSPGHDLLGNGLAHCHLNHGFILLHLVGPKPAAATVRNGLQLVDPSATEKLQRMLTHALAEILKNSNDPEEFRQALEAIDSSLTYFCDAQSEPALRTKWVAGFIRARQGLIDCAIQLYSEALEIARALAMEAEAAAITADIGLIHPSPREILGEIEGLAIDDATPDSLNLFPGWFGAALEEHLRALWLAASEVAQGIAGIDRIYSAARSLRDAAMSTAADDGNSLVPAAAY